MTIVEVKGGGVGPRRVVKDHTFAIFNFGTLPLAQYPFKTTGHNQ